MCIFASVARGGAACTNDEGCGPNGLCIGKRCICQLDWLCSKCTMTQTDLLYGLTCETPNGGGRCNQDTDCGHGRCLKTDSRSYCECHPLYACAHCSASVPDLVSKRASCPSRGGPVEAPKRPPPSA